jgi:hypothetical protein
LKHEPNAQQMLLATISYGMYAMHGI